MEQVTGGGFFQKKNMFVCPQYNEIIEIIWY